MCLFLDCKESQNATDRQANLTKMVPVGLWGRGHQLTDTSSCRSKGNVHPLKNHSWLVGLPLKIPVTSPIFFALCFVAELSRIFLIHENPINQQCSIPQSQNHIFHQSPHLTGNATESSPCISIIFPAEKKPSKQSRSFTAMPRLSSS